MVRDKSYRLILMVALVTGLILSGILVSLAQPPAAPTVAPKLETKLVPSKIKVPAAVESKLLLASKDLVAKNLSSELARGFSSTAETTVLKRTPKGYVAETIVLNLLKETYTAEMSRIEFSYEDDKATITKIEKVYQPKVPGAPRQVGRDAKLEGEKGKLNVFKAPAVPDDPGKFDFEKAIKDAEEAERREGPRSWWLARGLANTPCTEFPSAVTATRQIRSIMATRFGGSAAERIGAVSTEKEITDFLKYDYYLLCWNNIGHGVTAARDGAPCYGLVQWAHAVITHTEFSALNPYRGLYWCVALANSCNSFKDPLNAAIWSKRPRTYIGGNINLHVNRSEWAARNFWYFTLLLRQPMGTALTRAQATVGYPPGTYGLRGDSGVF